MKRIRFTDMFGKNIVMDVENLIVEEIPLYLSLKKTYKSKRVLSDMIPVDIHFHNLEIMLKDFMEEKEAVELIITKE